MRILFVQKRPLFPANTGGKIRTLNVLKHLCQWHDITYLCNRLPDEGPRLDEMTELGMQVESLPWRETARGTPRFALELVQNLFSPYPYNVNKDFDRPLRDRYRELLKRHAFDLVICDFVQMSRNVIGLDSPPKILFQHNVEAEIFQRHTHRGSLPKRAYMWLQWRKMHRFEGRAGREFNTVIAVSDRDRIIYGQQYGWRHVQVIDTAVDTHFFAPDESPEVDGQVLFVGSLDWLPNQDGVEHFVHRVWPRVRASCPQAVFRVVGRNPSHRLLRLQSCPGVEIVGTVPDTRPHLASASLVVVPLYVGGGTRLKIFEAMSMQKAVVSTPLGAEGLQVDDGAHILIGNNDDQMVSQIVDLLNDASRRQQIAAAAREMVIDRFSAEVVARQFEQICQNTVQQAHNTKRPSTSLVTPT